MLTIFYLDKGHVRDFQIFLGTMSYNIKILLDEKKNVPMEALYTFNLAKMDFFF